MPKLSNSNLTPEEILTFCKVSKEFFFENFYNIPVVGVGAQLFKMRPYQRDIANRLDQERLIIGLKARQIGWTTIAVANAVHDALFTEEHPWLLVSRNQDAAQKMLKKAVYAYHRLPEWMKRELPQVTHQTQDILEFKNGSYIESVPATGDTGRGDAVHGALLDECAFMEYAEDIWGAVSPLVYGPTMLFSTANGMGNFFHETWLEAQRPDTAWTSIFYPWDVVTTRDEAWYEHERLSFRGREWLFFQEYPASPEEAFAKSGRVAFVSDILSPCFVEKEPDRRLAWNMHEKPSVLGLGEPADIPIDIWTEPTVVRDEYGRPVYKPNYVVGVDVAEGLEHGDFTYISVFDANEREQVATCKSAIPISYLDELIVWLAEYYHKALVIVERNNAGVLPIDRLYRDHWYARLYRMDKFGEIKLQDRTPRYGWRTDPSTKPKMVNDFIYALSEQDVILHDPDFMIEAQTFVANGKGSYAATSGNHDDVIMGTLVAWQGVLDSPKYQILWRDEKNLPPTHDEMDAIWYKNERSFTNADLLEAPLGQRPVLQGKKTVLFTPENFRQNS